MIWRHPQVEINEKHMQAHKKIDCVPVARIMDPQIRKKDTKARVAHNVRA